MKKKLLCLEFTIILALFLLPPIFVKPAEITTLSFSPIVFIYLAIAVILNIQSTFIKKTFLPVYPQKVTKFSYATWGTLCFGILMINFALLQIIGLIFPQTANASTFDKSQLTGNLILLYILQLAIMAFEEEVLYREFCPLCLEVFAENKSINFRKIYKLIVEIFMLVIFALGHRYMGWIPVLNAFFCGIALRLCAFKTDSIYTGTIIHFLFNLINFLLLIFGM